MKLRWSWHGHWSAGKLRSAERVCEDEGLRAARLRREQMKNTARAAVVFGPEMKGVSVGFCRAELEMAGTMEATAGLCF